MTTLTNALSSTLTARPLLTFSRFVSRSMTTRATAGRAIA